MKGEYDAKNLDAVYVAWPRHTDQSLITVRDFLLF